MRKLFLLLALLVSGVGTTWAQFTWTNSSTAITTEAWASADNWTCAEGTTFPTEGAGPMTTNSNAWQMVNFTNCSGTVADLEGWNPKMTLDATTLTVENMRKMQGGDKNFTLKNGSTLSITLHKSNSGNDGATVPITFTGNGNTFNLYLAGNMGGDGTIVNYGAVTDASTNKYNVSSDATGTARTFNALTLKATIEGAATAEENTLHSVVLGNISSDITVTTLTYDITADNFNKAEGVLTASDADAGKYSVVKGADGNVTLCWVTGPNPATPTVFPSNAKVYTIKGYTDTSLNAYYDGTNNFIKINGTAGTTDNYKWAVYTIDNKTYLYNIGAQKLVYQTSGTGGHYNWNLAADIAHAMIIDKTGDYYTIHSEYCTGTYDYLHYNSGYTYGSTNWTADGDNSKWVIAEAGDLDASVASAIETMVADNKFTLPAVDKYYKITGIVGDVKEYISLQDGARVASQTASNPLTTKDVWKLTQGSAEGKYYIRNAYDDTQYFGFDGVSTTPYDWQMEISTDPVKKNWFSLYGVAKSRYLGVGTNNMVGNDLYAGAKQTNTAWNSYYYSTNFQIEPVNVYTLTINTEPAVAGVFTWNGETKRGTSVTFSHVSGATVDNSAISFIENGYTAALDEDTWNGESNLTVTAKMSESFFSSLYGDKWVRITSAINANAAMYATEHMGTENIDVTNDAELFCFVGNASDGFQIFNKAKGQDYALYVENGEESVTNGTEPSWVKVNEEQASTWYLDTNYLNAASQPGYGLTTEQSPSRSLNLWGGSVGEAKFWNNGAGNGGSRWFIQQVDENLINIDLAEDNPYANNYMLGKVNIAYGGTSTTSYITRDNVGTQTLYLPIGLTPTVSVAYQYRGYTHSQEGNDITFTNDGTKYQYLWYEDPDYQFYRIPAIITKPNGQLIAFSDYRYCHNDIGFGRVDQYMRMSSDNGESWTEPTLVLVGKDEIAEGEDVFYKGFGDPALVADRESDRILLMTVAGNNFYGNGNTNYWNGKPNYFARTYSENGGASWGNPENITEQIYTLFSETAGDDNHVDAAFVGSGKVFQSRVTKVGEYYRLYAALCARPGGNRVIYSDDFGMTWKVLGGASARPAPSGDEPKCEELPDGSVILSSRKSYGRYFNIYTYTDAKTGAGAWGDCIDSSNSGTTGGIAVGNNSTNGEIMIVNAKKKNDDKIYTVALQSLPFGNGRNGVGLYWKDITDKSTYQVDGANSSLQFAKNWTRGLKVETLCDTYGTSVGYSAYSTFTLQDDHKIGFFYEESPGTYAMVYVPLGIDEITDNAYSEIVSVTPLKATSSSSEDAVFLEGDITTPESVAGFVGTAGCVDLTQTEIQNGITIEAIQKAIIAKTGNSNILIYAPTGTSVQSGTTNVVVNDVCQNLVLSDGLHNFFIPNGFTASAVSYSRSNTGTWSTICLPFVPISSSVTFYSLQEVGANYITLIKEEGNLQANTPYLVKSNGYNTLAIWGLSGYRIAMTDEQIIHVASKQEDGWLVGVLKSTSVVDGDKYTTAKDGYSECITDGNAFYLGASDDAFHKINGRFNLKPFRAYISCDDLYEVRELLGLIEVGDETGVQTIESEDGKKVTLVFDLQGRKQNDLQKGINIVDGKKVIKQ